jgi:hypothetical protein
MKQETLIKLAEHSSYPCIAIFIPTHPLIPDRYTDAHRIKEIFGKLKFDLVEAHNQRSFNLTDMLIKTEDLLHSIDFNHQQNGIGIYISPTVSETVSFPFIPRERIVINNHFPLREIYYLNQLEKPYYLLNLHRDSVELFEGQGKEISEIYDGTFPMQLEDNYEYESSVVFRSNGSVTTKQYEKEKSVVQEKQTEQFYRKADKQLPHLKFPILLAGQDQHIHDFIEISKNQNLISGTIHENLRSTEKKRLGELASLMISDQNKNNDLKIRKELDELFGGEMAVFGITNCWKYAREGEGLILYVEYDLFESAYISNDETRIKRRLLFRTMNYRRIPDMVEKIIDEVIKKGGKVHFTRYGSLKDYDGIALRLRYPA